MPFLTVNRVSLHYIERGRENPQTTVMVHGLGDNLSIWYLTANSAQLSGHHLVMYDLRGHGKSEMVESGYDLETLSSELSEVIDQLAHDCPINLVGNSLGSTIALRYAQQYPEKIARMVLVEPTLPPFTYEDDDPDNTPEEWLNRAPPGSRKVFAQHPFIMSRVLNKYLTLKEKTSVIDDLLSEKAFDRDKLAALNIPTLVITAKSSNWMESSEFVVASMPQVKQCTFEASHFIMLEATKQVSAAIGEFLQQ